MKLLILGDTHGYGIEMRRAIHKAAALGCDAILQLGDFGYWPRAGGQKFLKNTSKLAKHLDVPVYWIDGNHEDFGHLHENFDKDSTEPVKIRDHVYWLPRGVRWEWEGVSFLAMGGAASIDRAYRTLGHSWFIEEMISDVDVEKAQPADILVSHDAPFNPLEMLGQRFIINEDSEFCRQQLKRVVNIAQPELVLHGHYHMYHDTMVLREGGYSRVIGLGCDGDPDNIALLTVEDGSWEYTPLVWG